MPHVVYVLHVASEGLYKVGHTRHDTRRLRELTSRNRAEIVQTIELANLWAAKVVEGMVLDRTASARKFANRFDARNGQTEHWNDSMPPPDLNTVANECAADPRLRFWSASELMRSEGKGAGLSDADEDRYRRLAELEDDVEAVSGEGPFLHRGAAARAYGTRLIETTLRTQASLGHQPESDATTNVRGPDDAESQEQGKREGNSGGEDTGISWNRSGERSDRDHHWRHPDGAFDIRPHRERAGGRRGAPRPWASRVDPLRHDQIRSRMAAKIRASESVANSRRHSVVDKLGPVPQAPSAQTLSDASPYDLCLMYSRGDLLKMDLIRLLVSFDCATPAASDPGRSESGTPNTWQEVEEALADRVIEPGLYAIFRESFSSVHGPN